MSGPEKDRPQLVHGRRPGVLRKVLCLSQAHSTVPTMASISALYFNFCIWVRGEGCQGTHRGSSVGFGSLFTLVVCIEQTQGGKLVCKAVTG